MLLPDARAFAADPPAAPAADPAKSSAAFATVAKVLLHPRCRNCHPDGDRPLHGDPPFEHPMNVQRRLEQLATPCKSCHPQRNMAGAHRPPGAPRWGLAPREQVFQGRTPAALCRQLKDPAQNGNRSLEALLHHMTEDPLVLWAWSPGEGRPPVAVPQAEYALAVRTWIENGAECPAEEGK